MSIYFGKNLRFLRKQKGINQAELAALVKKGHTTIGNWENGISEPSLTELYEIVNFFGISADDLLFKDLSGEGSGSKKVNEPLVLYGNDPNIQLVNEITNLKTRVNALEEAFKKFNP